MRSIIFEFPSNFIASDVQEIVHWAISEATISTISRKHIINFGKNGAISTLVIEAAPEEGLVEIAHLIGEHTGGKQFVPVQPQRGWEWIEKRYREIFPPKKKKDKRTL